MVKKIAVVSQNFVGNTHFEIPTEVGKNHLNIPRLLLDTLLSFK